MRTLCLIASMLIVSVTGFASSNATASGLQEGYDYEAMYWKARTANLYQVAYSDESAQRLHAAYIPIELSLSVNDILQKIRQPDAEFATKLEALRVAYEGLEKVTDYEDVTYDLWEGHTELPVPGGVDPNGYDSGQAVLTDTDGFRPFISDFRLEDPASAKGTLIAVPSIRASYSELTAIARIFNRLGFNVFTVHPRLDMIGGIDGLNWIMLQMDAQRAIRYVRYHANDFKVDPDKLFLIAGSKGNLSHPTTYNYFDMLPTDYAVARDTSLSGYENDAIDAVPSDVKVSIVSYGTMILSMFNDRKFDEGIILNSRIYSTENYAKGFKFPDIVILAGNLDRDTVNLGPAIDALYAYNQREDKLYTIHYEAHLVDAVPHGFGAGLQYPNLTTLWDQVGVFVESRLQAEQ